MALFHRCLNSERMNDIASVTKSPPMLCYREWEDLVGRRRENAMERFICKLWLLSESSLMGASFDIL